MLSPWASTARNTISDSICWSCNTLRELSPGVSKAFYAVNAIDFIADNSESTIDTDDSHRYSFRWGGMLMVSASVVPYVSMVLSVVSIVSVKVLVPVEFH